MRTWVLDTSPEALDAMVRVAREMTPEAKLRQVSALIRASRQLAVAGLRSRHPRASSPEISRRLAALLLGDDLALKVYGPIPSQEEQ